MKTPSGSVISEAVGVVPYANLKVVQFDVANYGTGTYQIVVNLRNPEDAPGTTSFGVAWR